MIELAKHIEVLLLENDCVIVPGLGGFIAHNRTAIYKDETNEFCPPARTIGFNPQLTINDGLLAQSYMQAYNTDFPDATRKIEKVVTLLKEQLYQEGRVELKDIGILFYNIKGKYEFEPAANAFFTPCLYGLEKLSLPLLPAKRKIYPVVPSAAQVSKAVSLRGWIRNAVAVAAAILLFFILSIPVENTYVDEASYASLGSTDMFEAIRSQSVATTVAQNKEKKAPQKVRNNINTLKPVAVKTEKVVVPAEKADKPVVKKADTPTVQAKKPTVKNAGKKSYIIIASLATSADADRQIKRYKENGYKDVQILESDGRYRIALHAASSRSDAYREVNELRKNDLFKNAWVFTAK